MTAIFSIVFVVVLGLYVVFEAIDPLAKMRGGLFMMAHKAKYIGAAAVAVWMMYGALFQQPPSLREIVALVVLAGFIYPRTQHRISEFRSHANY